MDAIMHILNFIKPNLFFLNLKTTDKFALFQKMYEKLYEGGFVKESFLNGVIEREKKYPTGLQLNGYGCAVPHTDIAHVITPAIAVATLHQPLEFQVMGDADSKVKVNAVFMLALNKEQDQVKMLSELALMLQNQDVMNKIMAAESSREVFQVIKDM